MNIENEVNKVMDNKKEEETKMKIGLKQYIIKIVQEAIDKKQIIIR